MSYPASLSILSLFSPFPASPPRAGNQPILAGSRILLGSVEAPYHPEGRRDLVALREMVCAWQDEARHDQAADPAGLSIAITTRSPLLLHDLDLLVEMDRDHAVGVDVLLPDLDSGVVRRLEPQLDAPPAPEARIELVRRLAAEGIATRVLCVPLPADAADAAADRLEPLLAAVREAGAWDVATDLPDPALAAWPGRSSRRNRFRAWKRWSSSPIPLPSPRLHTRGQRHPQPEPSEQALAAFYRLRLEQGFPRAVPGRG
jgi:hypothetical protein